MNIVIKNLQLLISLPFFLGLLEEGEDFTEFRNRVVELIKDVVFIVGSANVFKHMFAFLATCHQSNSWESSEAALFIMVCFVCLFLTEQA
jgi:hypothetical protein